jgi:predicted O-methyltransferase YrrM
MSHVQAFLAPEVADYIRQVTLREPEALRRLRAEPHPRLSMETSPEQAQFLHLLAHAAGARRAIEIGVFRGYSSTFVALALPPGGKVVACDNSEEYTARARRTWREAGVEDRIDLRLAPALQTLDALIEDGEAGAFDLAYIDADKANYLNYYERCLTLVRKGGMIAADNVLWEGAVIGAEDRSVDTEALRVFNRSLHDDPRVAITLLPIGDGLSLACKL